MNRIKLGIFIFFFLSTVWFSHFKRKRITVLVEFIIQDFWRSVTGFLGSRCSKPLHSVLGRYGWVFHTPAF